MSSFRAVKLVGLREIREGLRNRAFLLTFAIILLLIVAMAVIPALLQDDDAIQLGVVDPSPVAGEQLAAQAEMFDIDLHVQEVADVESGESALREGQLDVLLVGADEIVVEEQLDQTLRAVLSESVEQRTVVDQLDELGLDEEEVGQVLRSAEPLAVRSLDEPTEDTAFIFATLGTVLLLMGVTFFASSVLTGVVEEKSSRVVEVVLGAMRPWQLLAGKVLGMSTLAFSQVVILVLVGVGAVSVTGAAELPEATPAIVAAVIGWFVLGFALYSVVYAAAGSLASRIEDAQSSAGPIGFVIFAAYMATFAVVLPNPDGPAAVVISLIPPLAPLTMPARVALGAVTPIETVAAVTLTIAAIVGAVLLAGRVYERSILRTERVTWSDALRRQPT